MIENQMKRFIVKAQPKLFRSISLLCLLIFFVLNAFGQIPKQDFSPLLPNQPLERSMKSSEKHSYIFKLKAKEFFQVNVEQNGIDVELVLTDAAGNILVNRDVATGIAGLETLSFIAAETEDYLLEIRAAETEPATGTYIIKRETPRVATAQDIKRITAETLLQRGLQLKRTKNVESLREACRKFETASLQWRAIGDKFNEALTQTMLAFTREDLTEIEKAVAAHQKALLLYQALRDKESEAISLSRLSVLNAYLQKTDLAVRQYRLANALYRELKEDINEEILKKTLGKIAGHLLQSGYESSKKQTLAEYRNALKFLLSARTLYRELEDEKSEAVVLTVLGRIKDDLGEKSEALNYNFQARAIWKKTGEKSSEAVIVSNIAGIYSDLADFRKALDYYRQTLSLKRENRDEAGEATALNNIGYALNNLDEKQNALESYDKALSLHKKLKNNSGIAGTLNNIGQVYDSLGEKETALGYYIQALEFWRVEPPDKMGEASTLNNIGRVYDDLGEKQEALNNYNQALAIQEASGIPGSPATTLNNIGTVFFNLGDSRKALEYDYRALNLYRAVKDKVGEARSLNNIASALSSLDEMPEALNYYNQALRLWKAADDKSGQATIFNNIGRIYDDSGEERQALDYYNRALLLYRKVGDKFGEATSLNNIALIYDDLGKKQKALDYYYQTLPLQRAINNRIGEASTLANMMIYWRNMKNPQFAIFYGKQSVNTYQQLRFLNQDLEDRELQKVFLKSIEYTYRYLANLLIEQERLPEAQQVLNSFKDQQYFDFQSESLKKPVPLTMTAREAKLASQYASTSDRIGKSGSRIERIKRTVGTADLSVEESVEIKRLETELQVASNEFLAVLEQAEKDFSETPGEEDKVGEISDLTQMQSSLHLLNEQLEGKTVAVYQLVGESNFSALLITENGIDKISVPIKGTKLKDNAVKLWALLQSDQYDTTVLSKEIYDVVFSPLENNLPQDTKTIMWQLDGSLRYIPMGVLFNGRNFLAERYQNVVFTRTDRERMTRDVSKIWNGVGFGNSQAATVEILGKKISFRALPGVSQELRDIFRQNSSSAGIIDGEVFPDDKFNAKNFYEAVSRKLPLVHISSHFVFSPGDDSRSFLLLGDRTPLTLNDLKKKNKLFQDVDLLTLSACNTAAILPDANGREIDGFAELAQRLGAGAVIATLWSVSDASTPWLMREFYFRHSKGNTKAEALQKAQRALIDGTSQFKPLSTAEKSGQQSKVRIVIVPKGKKRGSQTVRGDIVYLDEGQTSIYDSKGKPKYAHPYYWSPFVLYGNLK